MKKESKAQRMIAAYAKHGIKYNYVSNKIYAPILDKWISPVLVNGNEKIGKGVYHGTVTGMLTEGRKITKSLWYPTPTWQAASTGFCKTTSVINFCLTGYAPRW